MHLSQQNNTDLYLYHKVYRSPDALLWYGFPFIYFLF